MYLKIDYTDYMLPIVTALLGTALLTKSVEKNSKQWEKMDDQVKKDDSSHCSIKAASHSFMSLSITQ